MCSEGRFAVDEAVDDDDSVGVGVWRDAPSANVRRSFFLCPHLVLLASRWGPGQKADVLALAATTAEERARMDTAAPMRPPRHRREGGVVAAAMVRDNKPCLSAGGGERKEEWCHAAFCPRTKTLYVPL